MTQRELGQDQFTRLVRHAYDRGILFFETSETYGEMHKMLGMALKGIPRDTYRLMSKVTTREGVNPQDKIDELRKLANTNYFEQSSRDSSSFSNLIGLSAGSSAVETILQSHPERPMVIFAVWEPILPTDWGAPGTSVLGRLHDHRRQFWDPDHLVAAEVKTSETLGTPHPNCCVSKGSLWDLTAAYAPGARWLTTLPAPILLNGPVVRTR